MKYLNQSYSLRNTFFNFVKTVVVMVLVVVVVLVVMVVVVVVVVMEYRQPRDNCEVEREAW